MSFLHTENHSSTRIRKIEKEFSRNRDFEDKNVDFLRKLKLFKILRKIF